MGRKKRAERTLSPCSRRRSGGGPVVHLTDAPSLSVRGLSVTYDDRLALSDVSFALSAGERLAVVGPNGAGKTTLLKAIAGLLSPAEGAIEVHGHAPIGHICIAYVPQRSEVDWRFPVTVFDVVMMGRIGRLGPIRRPQAADRALVRRALDQVELLDLSDRQIQKLSGGQQQRMFIARALAQEAELVLMDEPFAGLDVPSRDEVLHLTKELPAYDVTLLVALHDLGLATAHFDRVLLLNGRLLGFGTPAEVFTPEILQRAYGSCLRMVHTDGGVLVVHDTACSGGEP
jgi:ABC-type Mn2+/Zn2+ transport system ATPase subunit